MSPTDVIAAAVCLLLALLTALGAAVSWRPGSCGGTRQAGRENAGLYGVCALGLATCVVVEVNRARS